MTKTKKLSWTPIRRGATYCAPACGSGCTWKAYSGAVVQASELAERLGEGWTPDVSENMGWHYQVQSPCGRIRVSPIGREGGYHAFLGEPDGVGGRWVEDGQTPEVAVAEVIAAARAELKELGAYLEGMEAYDV